MAGEVISDRLEQLRAEMKRRGVSGMLFLGTDPHQSEYVAPRWMDRAYISGFTGSAGTLAVSQEEAALWSDSRYWIQGPKQLEGSGISFMRDGDPSVSSPETWLAARLAKASMENPGTLALDFASLSESKRRALKRFFSRKGVELVDAQDLLSLVWSDRPEIPAEPVFSLDLKYTGSSRGEKLDRLRDYMQKEGGERILISALDEIAWTLNLRGSDISYNPLFYSYLLIDADTALLYCQKEAFSSDLSSLLEEQGVCLSVYGDFAEDLVSDQRSVIYDPDTLCASVAAALGDDDCRIERKSPVAMMKALKNEQEIAGAREALRKDGIALTRFWMRLERLAERGSGDEYSIGQMLFEERSRMPGCISESFAPIVAFREHGAICHYSAEKSGSFPVEGDGMLLIDSGAQYLEGTTDITRVFAIGSVGEEARYDYTMVLKSHIALAKAVFPAGSSGSRVDALARRPLWEACLDFGHGTGHGVGAFLNVHEGPQSISSRSVSVPLKAGMICSNEPGLYREGKQGVRIENLILVREAFQSPFGSFLSMETLTPFPLDRRLIDPKLLSGEERIWVDDYHRWVYERLSPDLDPRECSFLAEKTGAL